MTLNKAPDQEEVANPGEAASPPSYAGSRMAKPFEAPDGNAAAGDRVLLLEGEASSREALESTLTESGYEVRSTGLCEDALRLARETEADVLVLDDRLAGLDCGDLLAEFKSASPTAGIRVFVLVRGAAPDRVHALDLGADDVLSRPFAPLELEARIRVQLRLKRREEELRGRLRLIEQSQEASRAAIVASQRINREASGFRRALKVGLLVFLMALLAVGAVYYRFSRRVSRDIQRNDAAVASLNRSLANQQELIERAHRLSEQMKTSSASTAQKEQELVQRSGQLRAGLADASPDSASDLQRELTETEARLQRLEDESSLAAKIIRDYAPSVCLIYVSVAFRDTATGRSLRYATTSEGDFTQDLLAKPQATLEGSGPEFRMDVLGTGFLVGKDGRILTNRHVVQPWWHNDDLADLTKKGLQPVVAEMRAYFPGSSQSYPLSPVHISRQADLALVSSPAEPLNRKTLALDGSARATVRGEPIVLMGYATGLDAVLARLDNSTLRDIVSEGRGNSREILDRLAERKLIRPLITQGHLGDVLPDQIVYDAQTAAGGSGGPVFNREGKVIGVNHAIIEGFGGSNLGVPARFAEPLLAR
jgi:DNA-binding response OmpR family regulator/S1-C subfamily serine protease